MLKLEKKIVHKEVIELEDGVEFVDEWNEWVFLTECVNKQSIKQYIDEFVKDGDEVRMVAPGGAVSNPRNIKKSNEKKRIKRPPVSNREKYPRKLELVSNDPIGRMRFLARALKK